MAELFKNVEPTICMQKESKKFDLEYKISILMNESKFQEALELLEQLQTMQNDKARKINTQLMISQCQIKLRLQHGSAIELAKLITSSPVQPDDLKETANIDVKQKKYVRAFLYYFSASKFYKEKYLGDDAAQGIKACVQAVEMFVEEMIKQDDGSEVITDYIIPALKEVTDDLSNISNADPRYRVRLQAWCLQSIGLCYKHCEDYQQFADNVESAIKLLKSELKEDANHYRVFGICLHSSGEVHEELDEKGQALDLYERAIEAKNGANDWPSSQIEHESKELSREKLRIIVEFYEAKLSDSRKLMMTSKFSEALDLLCEIQPMLRDVEDKMEAQLIKIESYMMMEKSRMVYKEMDELVRLMLSSKKSADDVKKMAKDKVTAKLYINGFLRYFSACKLYHEKPAGNDAVIGIKACVDAVRLFVKKMINQDEKMKKIITDYIIRALKEVTDDLSKIPNADPKYQVRLQALCLRSIGLCYKHCEDYQQFADNVESAIELLKRELKEDADKYWVFGICLHNSGEAHEKLDQKGQAMDLYERAIEAKNDANDWPSNLIKHDSKELSLEKLRIMVEFYEAKLDDSRILIRTSKFSEALNLLHGIEPMLRDVEGKIKALLIKIECYMMMEQHRKVVREMDQLARLMLSSKKTANDVMKMAEDDITAGLYISGFLRYFSACKLYKEESSGNNTGKGIEACVVAVQWFVEKKINQGKKMKKIVTDYIIPALEEVTDDLSKIPNSDQVVQVEQQAWCLYSIARCYSDCQEYQRYAEFNESAIELMEKQFKKDAKKYCVVGYCYHNAGLAYECSKQKEKSKKMFRRALDAYNKATDWPNEEMKMNSMKQAVNSLRS